MILDPEEKEECIISGALTIASNMHSEICCAQLSGGVSLDQEQVGTSPISYTWIKLKLRIDSALCICVAVMNWFQQNDWMTELPGTLFSTVINLRAFLHRKLSTLF